YPWAVEYTHPLSPALKNYPVHPVQLYEASGLLILGILLIINNRYPRWSIPTWWFYLLGYGVLRFFLEFFRGDLARGGFAGFSTSQWLGLGLIFVFLFLAFLRRTDHNSPHESRNRKP